MIFALWPIAHGAVNLVELPATRFEGRTMAEVSAGMKSARSGAGPEHRFAAATVDFLAAVEALCQRFHRLGLNYQLGRSLPVPFLRLQLPVHPAPEPARAEDVRAVLDEFYARLAEVEHELAPLANADFRVAIPLHAMAMDFDGSGAITDGESFLRLFEQFNRAAVSPRRAVGAPGDDASSAAPDLTVVFDQADAHWLLAYTHFLRGVADLFLAHDGGSLFQATGQLFFVRAATPLAREPVDHSRRGGSHPQIADAIALIHELRLPVASPERLERARQHFLAMTRGSRAMLTALAAETDDDREWIPNARQTSALGPTMNDQRIAGWARLMAELEAILEGEKLVPHWRFSDGRGVNVKRLLQESRRTDLVLLAQGSDAVPFLERGELSAGATWREVMALFRGNFVGFAILLN